MKTACACPIAGYCERHDMAKSENMVKLCRTNQKYFDHWERKVAGSDTPAVERRRWRRRAPMHGAGTELMALLKERGYALKKQCACLSRIRAMNRWGADGCREHIDEILAWLEKSAKEAGGTTALAFAIPAVRSIARGELRRLVELAIDRAGAPLS